MDIDHIPAGVDFVEYLNSKLAACKVLLVVIGPNWLNAKDEAGQRRLDKPDDYVAIEIEAALVRDIRVIPILVDGAAIPKPSELPDSLKRLARRQGVEVRHNHFGRDVDALIGKVSDALGSAAWRRPWRWMAAASATAALLLAGSMALFWFRAWPGVKTMAPQEIRQTQNAPWRRPSNNGSWRARQKSSARLKPTPKQKLSAGVRKLNNNDWPPQRQRRNGRPHNRQARYGSTTRLSKILLLTGTTIDE